MKISFSGFGSPVLITRSKTTTLEIQNRVLFSRVCEALISEAGEDAVEPYTFWNDDDVELKSKGQILPICDSFHLPWDDRVIINSLLARIENLLCEDEDCRSAAERDYRRLNYRFTTLALQLGSEYTFDIDWDPKRYLKSFGFRVDMGSCEMLLDKLILFLTMLEDISFERTIMFINLKIFLSNSEVERFFEHVFFSNLKVLMLESVPDSARYINEMKYTVDQDFLENLPISQTESTVPMQKGICPNGFGAVSF